MSFHVLCHPGCWPRLLSAYSLTDRLTRVNSGDICELSSIGVNPEAAGKGIGSALVRGFTQRVSGRARYVTLDTSTKNNDAVNRFYQNLGFRL
jgi:ribosomal protein S18 acetylase RimI-like enzyme